MASTPQIKGQMGGFDFAWLVEDFALYLDQEMDFTEEARPERNPRPALCGVHS